MTAINRMFPRKEGSRWYALWQRENGIHDMGGVYYSKKKAMARIHQMAEPAKAEVLDREPPRAN